MMMTMEAFVKCRTNKQLIEHIKMNKNNKQSDREILEEILKILRNLSVSPIVVQDPMKLYNNKELMENWE